MLISIIRQSCFSLSSDDGILLDGDICADLAEEAWLVGLWLKGPHTFSKRERECIVIRLDLAHCDGGLLTDSCHGSILGVEPRSLNVGVLLRVTLVAMFLR